MRASTEFADGRYWTNVGHICTRCLSKIRVSEKSERFVTKRGALRARHTGDCPRSRPHKVPEFTIGDLVTELWDGTRPPGDPPDHIAAQITETPGCGCATCLHTAGEAVLTAFRRLPYGVQDAMSQRDEWYYFTARFASFQRSYRTAEQNPGDTYNREVLAARDQRLRPHYARIRRLLWERAGV